VIFRTAGFELLDYRYYDAASHGLDFAGMLEDLASWSRAPSCCCMRAATTRPASISMRRSGSRSIELLKERQLLPFIDMAYQGFDQGLDADATAVRLLAASGIEAFVVANSYSKSFSLYGERVGALSMVGSRSRRGGAVLSKIKQTIRTTIPARPRTARRWWPACSAAPSCARAGSRSWARCAHASTRCVRVWSSGWPRTVRRISASSRARPACFRIPA
jgi:aspartate/tyrosine/aromatic aminotransferase